MKCVCGYKHNEIEKSTLENVPFIRIGGNCSSTCMFIFKIQIEHTDFESTFLYACPKCGTIKTEV